MGTGRRNMDCSFVLAPTYALRPTPPVPSSHGLRATELREHPGRDLGVEEERIRLANVLEPDLCPAGELGQD